MWRPWFDNPALWLYYYTYVNIYSYCLQSLLSASLYFICQWFKMKRRKFEEADVRHRLANVSLREARRSGDINSIQMLAETVVRYH